MTPTVDQDGPYDFRFYSTDRQEPPHVHVVRDRNDAKFWLDPVRFERNKGYPQHELRKIQRLVEKRQDQLLEAWYDHFGD